MYREEFYYKAEYISIKNCREHIKSLSLKYNFYNIFIENIEISIGELFTNIIKHGQKGLAEENDIKINIFIDETNGDNVYISNIYAIRLEQASGTVSYTPNVGGGSTSFRYVGLFIVPNC